MQESGEMYLETIYVLKNNNGSVRSIDVAKKLNFSKPSVSRGIGILKKDGYVIVDKNGYLDLTEKGLIKAKGVFEKHRYLTMFLMETAKVPKELAEEDACRIEHIISEGTFQGIKDFLQVEDE